MFTSARWINDYLDPPASPEEQAELLTRAGFPLEQREEVEVSDGIDVRQDYEMTSNRGDCVCHLGLAREIAAISGRALKPPVTEVTASGGKARESVSVTNREPDKCPLYTARIIRGVKIAPSPTWLADRLTARGDIPRNNVVDLTNFVLFEMGQPTHVFDLAKLQGSQIIVRMAQANEPFLPIGEGAEQVKLTAEDLVIADARRAVALAGVKGGALTAVTTGTTDILLEAASFDPVSVRNTSRRHNIASDSSYRFERGVHPAQVNEAADRLAGLILELAGGKLEEGVVADGRPIPEARQVSVRPERCRALLGVDISDEEMLEMLGRLGFQPQPKGDQIQCVAPRYRLDIEREIDLIEEVSRLFGHDRIPLKEMIQVRVAAPQPTERARQSVADTLAGLGFVETVTHSLLPETAAGPFLPEGSTPLRLMDGRQTDQVLRPSLIPSLLQVRRHNHDNGVQSLKLFESASSFHTIAEGHRETMSLGLLMDFEDPAHGLRPIRGVIERLLHLLLGPHVTLEVKSGSHVRWLTPAASASVEGEPIGVFGLLERSVAEQFGLDEPLLAAEVNVARFYEQFPPETEAHALPTFPAIERDLSVIVDDSVVWAAICAAVESTRPAHLEETEFVTTFRGRQIPPGKKSLTLRLRFRSPDRTLKHDEVDPQIDAIVKALREQFDAELRG